jgi:hypothetical protein
VIRRWLCPRALLLHLALAAITAGCLIAGWWQVHRAMAGNALSYLYSIEWPAFAVIAGIGWWQMVHDTEEDIAARRAYHASVRVASRIVAAATLPRSARAITTGTASDRRSLPGPTAGGELEGTDQADVTGSGRLATLGPSDPAEMPEQEAQRLLFAPDGEVLDEYTAYNRYLATLSARARRKTLRNPHGA